MANKRSTLTPENCRAPMAMDIQDVVLNVPSDGTDISLGITGAQVGQIAKITAVDTDGKPIKWEPVDIPSGGTDISLGLTSATVGQTIKVKAVDADGKPTAWEPADLPGGETWEKIIDTEVTEATLSFTCDGLNCNEIYIKCSKMENATSTNSTQDLYLNNTLVMNGATIVNKSGGGVYGWTLCRNNGIVWVVTKNNGALFESNLHQGVVYAQNNLISGVGPATTLKLSTANAMYAPITGKLEVWVR